MKDTLHFLDTVEIHDPDFDCDIDWAVTPLVLMIKMYLQHLMTNVSLISRLLSINRHFHSYTGHHLIILPYFI